MTDAADPLMDFLLDELARMELEAGFRARLAIPTVLETPTADWRTVRWSFRFTNQQVERSRRYVWSLPRERMTEALDGRMAAVEQEAAAQAAADPRVPRSASLASLLMEVQEAAMGAEVSVLPLADGSRLGVPHDAWALSLPVSATERDVSYRDALSIYSIKESVRVGPLRLLRPDACRLLPADA